MALSEIKVNNNRVTLVETELIDNSDNLITNGTISNALSDKFGKKYEITKTANPGYVETYLTNIYIKSGTSYEVTLSGTDVWEGLGICDQDDWNGNNTHYPLSPQTYVFVANGNITQIKVYLTEPHSYSGTVTIKVVVLGEITEQIAQLNTNVNSLNNIVTNISNDLEYNIKEDNELRELIVDNNSSEYSMEYVVNEPLSPYLDYSTFSGYAGYIGEVSSFRYLVTRIKCGDWGESGNKNTIPVSKVLIEFRQNDYNGQLLYYKTIDIDSISPGSDKLVFLDFGEEVSLNGNLYMSIRCNAIACLYIGQSTYPYSSAPNGRYYIDGNISVGNLGYEHLNETYGSLYRCLYKTIKFSVQLKDNQIQNISDRLNLTPNYPEISLPSTTYILKDFENSIYHKNYLSFWNPTSVGITKNGGDWKYYERCFRTTNAQSSLNIKLFDVCTLETITTKQSNISIGDFEKDTGQIVLNAIGDSFTQDGTWLMKINEYCPNVVFSAMRNTSANIKAEGRGGWTLDNYVNKLIDPRGAYEGFTPFLHPNDYIFYGIVEFWKDIVNSDISAHSYTESGYNDNIDRFDNNGYLLNPTTSSLMYNYTNGVYIKWNGSQWVTVTEELTFEFNYSKYIQAWNITSPDFVLIMLGVNDWWSEINPNTWNSNMNMVINSIEDYALENSKTIKIGICTNTTLCGSSNNSDSINPVYKRSLWIGRKNTIDTFDNSNYRNRNVFVVDTGVCLDPDYGFAQNEMLPFSYYTGTARELYDYNGCHPSTAGYYQLGTCAAAFIQSER